MFVVVVLACLPAVLGTPWYGAECSDLAEPVALDASKDGVKGRYVVRYCTAMAPPLHWELELRTLDEPEETCKQTLELKNKPSLLHSNSDVEITLASYNSSCPYVCLQQTLDLIFESCYSLMNQAYKWNGRKKITSLPTDTYLFVKNNLPFYTASKTNPHAECTDIGDKVLCTWLQGQIPYTEYTVMMWQGSRGDDEVVQQKYTFVNENCTRMGDEWGWVKCELYVAPGSYVIQLEHTAPWASGLKDLATRRTYFKHSFPEVPESPPLPKQTPAGLWALAGVCALVAVSSLAGLVVYQKRLKAKKIKVWRAWIARTESKAEAPAEDWGEGCEGDILLLYARDCPPAQRVAAALRALLQEHCKGKVLDLYSPEVMALAARSPSEFVRRCMTSPRVSVLLLQTPALAALHTVRVTDGNMESPLLPAHVVYKEPVFGDSLLALALQLVRETRPAAPYRKYRLLTLSDLSVDAFPSITPYARFSLPADAPALLHSLRAAGAQHAPGPHLEAQASLADACEHLVDYIRENPNYLQEQIVFL